MENEKFSKVCQEHGIKFIGALPEQIAGMGDKATAKATITMITVVHAATESPWPGSMWFSDIKSPLAKYFTKSIATSVFPTDLAHR